MKRRPVARTFAITFALALLVALSWFFVRNFARGTLEARVTYRAADERAAGFAALYLLDTDMMKLPLVKEGEESPLEQEVFRRHADLRNLARVLNARRREAYSLGPEVTRFVEESEPLWQPHVIRTARADADGRAILYNLKPGQYWLMARVETAEKGVGFWNLPVTVNAGENQISLTPFNSLQCSSCR
jgi:hypothetical protein